MFLAILYSITSFISGNIIGIAFMPAGIELEFIMEEIMFEIASVFSLLGIVVYIVFIELLFFALKFYKVIK